MLSYSLTTMMCFLTKEWYGISAYTDNLFIKAYHRIIHVQRGLTNHIKALCPWDDMLFFVVLGMMCF